MRREKLTDGDRRKLLARLQLVFSEWETNHRYNDVPLMDLITDVMLLYEVHLGYRHADFAGSAPDGESTGCRRPADYWSEMNDVRSCMFADDAALIEGFAVDLMDRLLMRLEKMFPGAAMEEEDVEKTDAQGGQGSCQRGS